MFRKMKDSGVEWLGMIPEDWQVRRLGTIGKFFSSGIDKKINEEEYPVKIVNYVDVYNNKRHELYNADYMEVTTTYEKIAQHCLKRGDLIFTPSSETIEDIGISALVMEDLDNTAYSYHVLRFVFSEEVYEGYKKYLCNNHFVRNYFSKCATGTIRKTLTRLDMKNAYIVLPPISEQQKIVRFLDERTSEINNIISTTQKTIEEYKAYRNSIISERIIFGMDATVQLKDSGIDWCPQIPMHWNVINPKALFSLRKEKAKQGDRQLTASQKKGIMYQDEYMESEGVRVVVVQKDFDILKHVEPDDFVISMRSFQGGLEYSELSGCISSAYVMLIPNKERVYSPFYKWFFKSSKYINAIQSTSNLVRDGQAMRYSNFAQVPLLDIPLEEQKEIAEYLTEKCAEIDALIAKKEAFVEEMETYKKSLIYEYVTGKKEVV